MNRFLDDEEPELERSQRDTELTLGVGSLVAIPLGLIALCALCFWLGYSRGNRTPPPAVTSAARPAAPDQEPLQGNGTIPKPSATAQAPVPPPTPFNNSAPSPSSAENSPAPQPAPSISTAAAQSAPPAAAPVSSAPVQPQVHSAIGANAPETGLVTPSSVRAALPSATALMVQVAAVSNPEDANALTSALRRRGYPVIAQRELGDGLIHVRVGPFPTRDEAGQWRMKLLNDGYNAVVQP